jgi:hypothetical protein
MEREFLGDSYDLVKRFWVNSLSPIAPIFADETFVPKEIREEYTLITRIPVFNPSIEHPYAVFLDPCTGIPSPRNPTRNATRKYAPLPFLVNIFERYHPKFLICFDQSFGFNEEKKDCMREKLNVLTSRGLFAFYYTSHANFLFVSESDSTIGSIKERLMSAGIPVKRLETNE